MKRFLKRLFRKPAILLVTRWANRSYAQGVQATEERHRRQGETIYLATNAFHPDKLVTYDKRQFKVEKRVYGYHARLLTMNTLKQGCWYYSADRYGNNGISEQEKEIRRKAFIKARLKAAKLI